MPLNPFDYVGKVVQKTFPNYGVYKGLVLEVVSVRGALYFRVEYEDGDMEDVPLLELKNILMPTCEGHLVRLSDAAPRKPLSGGALIKSRKEAVSRATANPNRECATRLGVETLDDRTDGVVETDGIQASTVGGKDGAGPAPFFRQEQLRDVGIEKILGVMRKYSDDSSRCDTKMLLLEAVGMYTFMMDDVNCGKTPTIFSQLEGSEGYQSKECLTSENNDEAMEPSPKSDNARIPMVAVPQSARSASRMRKSQPSSSNRQFVQEHQKNAQPTTQGRSRKSGTKSARRSQRLRVPPKRFRLDDPEDSRGDVAQDSYPEPRFISFNRQGSDRYDDDEAMLNFTDNSDEEPPLSAPEANRSGVFSPSPVRRSKFDPVVEKVLTLCKVNGLKVVRILKPSGGGNEGWDMVPKRVPKTRSLREILARGPRTEYIIGLANRTTAELPSPVSSYQVSPGSSDSTSEAMDMIPGRVKILGGSAVIAHDWESRPGVCNPNKVCKHKMEVTFVIRDLVGANLIHLGDKVQFRWTNREVLAEGWLTRVGILCNRCGGVVSCSEFSRCAGRRVRNPSAYIYVVAHGDSDTWMSLHDLEITLYSMSTAVGPKRKMQNLREGSEKFEEISGEPAEEEGAYDITLDMLFN
ncbi:hypothetical protein BSKO_05189 [Bryopsis sp. KO-2023]|nr:hypothetical protein BSKO_05189 [Bryopsis sp. KO-2023]